MIVELVAEFGPLAETELGPGGGLELALEDALESEGVALVGLDH